MANKRNNISKNRIQQTTKVDSKVKDIRIGIYDIDSALDYYFNQVMNDGNQFKKVEHIEI